MQHEAVMWKWFVGAKGLSSKGARCAPLHWKFQFSYKGLCMSSLHCGRGGLGNKLTLGRLLTRAGWYSSGVQGWEVGGISWFFLCVIHEWLWEYSCNLTGCGTAHNVVLSDNRI